MNIKQTLAVLITCYNRKLKTLECLNHLFNARKDENKIVLDVYLVDDGSTDGTSEAVTARFPQVQIVQGSGSLYWGGGMNKAWEAASKRDYDFYLWLNDDTFLNKDALEVVLKDSAAFSYKNIIVGVSEWVRESKVSYSGYLLSHKVAIKPQGKPVLCDYFNGNVVLVPKSVFSKLGFLDGHFPHNLGDIDYGMRARALGIQSYISSKAVAKCDGHLTLSAWCNPEVPLMKRVKHFNSPLTKGPLQVFRFELRHTSFPMAIFRSGIIYVRLLFPSLWLWMGKPKLGEG